MGVHELAGPLEASSLDVWAASPRCTDPLLVDGIGPLRPIAVGYREFEQEIAQRCRIEDGGVEKRNDDRQRSIAHVEFLGVGGKFVERSATCVVCLVLVTEDIVEPHAPVRSHPAEGNGARFEKPD